MTILQMQWTSDNNVISNNKEFLLWFQANQKDHTVVFPEDVRLVVVQHEMKRPIIATGPDLGNFQLISKEDLEAENLTISDALELLCDWVETGEDFDLLRQKKGM